MTDSYIDVRDGQMTGFVGPDASSLFRAITIRSSIKFYIDTGMLVTRGARIGALLQMTGEYTGKTYEGPKSYPVAIADLTQWIEAMKSAIPIVRKD